MKLLLNLIILSFCYFNLINANSSKQFVNFEVYSDSKCSKISNYGIGYSSVINKCLTFDYNNNFMFKINENEKEVEWSMFYNQGNVDNCFTDSPISKAVIYEINECLPSNDVNFNKNQILKNKKPFYYKLTISSTPYAPSNSFSTVYMEDSCNENNILLVESFINGTSVETNYGNTLNYYCSEYNNYPYVIHCEPNQSNCQTTQVDTDTCYTTNDFNNSTSSSEQDSSNSCGTGSGSGGNRGSSSNTILIAGSNSGCSGSSNSGSGSGSGSSNTILIAPNSKNNVGLLSGIGSGSGSHSSDTTANTILIANDFKKNVGLLSGIGSGSGSHSSDTTANTILIESKQHGGGDKTSGGSGSSNTILIGSNIKGNVGLLSGIGSGSGSHSSDTTANTILIAPNSKNNVGLLSGIGSGSGSHSSDTTANTILIANDFKKNVGLLSGIGSGSGSHSSDTTANTILIASQQHGGKPNDATSTSGAFVNTQKTNQNTYTNYFIGYQCNPSQH